MSEHPPLRPTLDSDVVPDKWQAVLLGLDPVDWRTFADVTETAASQGLRLTLRAAERNGRVLREMGGTERQVIQGRPYFRLTALGQRLQALLATRPTLYTELVHFVFSTLHEEQRRTGAPVSGWSWAYQATCQTLWESRPSVPAILDLAALVQHRFRDEFGGEIGVHRATPQTVTYWLQELDPPFLLLAGERRESRPRPWCSPELMALGIDRLYRQSGLPYGAPLRLTPEARYAIETLCLLDSNHFEEVSRIMLSTFPVIRPHSGEWGQSLILDKPFMLNDIM